MQAAKLHHFGISCCCWVLSFSQGGADEKDSSNLDGRDMHVEGRRSDTFWRCRNIGMATPPGGSTNKRVKISSTAAEKGNANQMLRSGEHA